MTRLRLTLLAAAPKPTRAGAIALVRGLSLLAGIVAAEWLAPGIGAKLAAGTSLLLFMPVFATGDGRCPTRCDNVPDSISITFSSIANGTCSSCTNYNTTYVVPWVVNCQGRLDSAFDASNCAGTSAGIPCATEVTWSFTTSGSNTVFSAQIAYGATAFTCTANTGGFSTTLGTAPTTCAGRGAVGPIACTTGPQGDATRTCDFSSATGTAVM